MGHDLKLLPATGGEARELVKADGLITTLAWTPYGQHLVFQRAFKRGVELWRVPAAGGEAQKLEVSLPNMPHQRIHPDGRQIAFSARSPETDKSEVWVLENFLPPLVDSAAPAAADVSIPAVVGPVMKGEPLDYRFLAIDENLSSGQISRISKANPPATHVIPNVSTRKV